MAYSKPWDETAPDGSTTLASDIDTVIQDGKVAIRERLEDFFPDWATDAADPKHPSGIVNAGTAAAKPATPNAGYDGQFYYETDTEKLFIGVGGAWVQLGQANLVAGPPRVMVHLTANESIPDATDTDIPWDATDYESPSTFWDVSAPTDLVVPEDGIYLIIFNVYLASDGSGTGVRQCIIRAAGASVAIDQPPVDSTFGSFSSVSALVSLSASDTIQGRIFQNSGGALNVLSGGQSNLSAIKVA